MKFTEQSYSIKTLIEQFQKNALLVNPEYQRGAVWGVRQKGKFIDSIFRNYPVPAVFVRSIEHQGLRGTHSTFELIDGQQRLRALSEYCMDKYPLPALSGIDRIRIPTSVAAQPAPWAGKCWSELSADLQNELSQTSLRTFVIEYPTSDDEVRDLFIRLQAGTALTRQQIRDAWPGPIAPFVESIGGKGMNGPKSKLLAMVDRRGERSDEDGQDQWVSHRQTCAQLLSFFLARERDAYARPKLSADDLDDLYHETVAFIGNSEVANRFRQALDATLQVFETATQQHVDGKKQKWRKVQIFAVFAVVQDSQRSSDIKLDGPNLSKLGAAMFSLDEQLKEKQVRFSSAHVAAMSEALREKFFKTAGRLDPVRAFPVDMQKAIWERTNGMCGVCGRPVGDGEAEYDHFPIPWAMCGQTSIDNGRLVHAGCHPRGRPKES